MLNVEMLSFIMLSVTMLCVIMLCITPQFLSLMLRQNKSSLIFAGMPTLRHDKQLNDDQRNNSVNNNSKMWYTLLPF
jgi:hypothetical protein